MYFLMVHLTRTATEIRLAEAARGGACWRERHDTDCRMEPR